MFSAGRRRKLSGHVEVNGVGDEEFERGPEFQKSVNS